MLPILLVVNTEGKKKKFIDKFIEENDLTQSNILTIRPVKTELTIDQIRGLKRDMMVSSALKRVVIIESLDISSAEVQNALLKTLEETTEKNQFIIPIKNLAKILPTIQSRSQAVIVDEKQTHSVSPATIEMLKNIPAQNKYEFLASQIVQGITRESAIKLLDEMLFYYRSKLEDESRSPKIMKKIMETKALIENNNLNPQLAVDGALLFIYKILKAKSQ